MSFEIPIHANSALPVRDELNKSLEKTVQFVDAYLADPTDPSILESAVGELRQVNGILRLLEFAGAIELSATLLDICDALQQQKLSLGATTTPVIAQGFVVLNRFIEHCFKVRVLYPLAVNDCVNQLRALLRHTVCLEASQIGFAPGVVPQAASSAGCELDAQDRTTVKRLLHMYQVGLVAVVRDKNTTANLRLMERAVSRLQRDFAGIANGEWWLLVGASLQLMRTGALRTSFGRKRTLAAIETYMRRRCRASDDAPMVLSEAHRDQLLLMIELSGDTSEMSLAIREQYQLPAASYNDAALGRVEAALTGDGEHALSGVAKEIQDELVLVKEQMEVYNDAMTVEAAGIIASRIQHVAEMLGRCGFSRLKGMLVDKAFQFNQSMAAGVTDRNAMEALAETMLLLENALVDPELFNDQVVSEQGKGTELLAKRILDEATGVVINESKSAISMAKSGISAYLESGFDPAHVANVGTSLAMVEGAFRMMTHQRAARVLQQCIAYIDGFGVHSATEKSRQSVETLADALISVEYYLDELSVSEQENVDLLAIAEESVAELGGVA